MYIHISSVTYGFHINNDRFKTFSVSGYDSDEKEDDSGVKEEPVTLQIRDFFSSRVMEINNGTRSRVNFYI